MIMTRRESIGVLSGLIFLGACAAPEAGAGNLQVTATMTSGANPGPDGSGRPLSLSLLQLRKLDGFAAADFASLQGATTTLAADLVRADVLVLPPGGTAAGTFPIDATLGATALGIVAGYRDPGGKTFRETIALPPTGDVTLNMTVGASGLTLT